MSVQAACASRAGEQAVDMLDQLDVPKSAISRLLWSKEPSRNPKPAEPAYGPGEAQRRDCGSCKGAEKAIKAIKAQAIADLPTLADADDKVWEKALSEINGKQLFPELCQRSLNQLFGMSPAPCSQHRQTIIMTFRLRASLGCATRSATPGRQ